MSAPDRRAADEVTARATATGAGLLAFMVAWLLGARLFGLAWDAPAGPVVAMSTAIVLGLVTGAVTRRRLRAASPPGDG